MNQQIELRHDNWPSHLTLPYYLININQNYRYSKESKPKQQLFKRELKKYNVET